MGGMKREIAACLKSALAAAVLIGCMDGRDIGGEGAKGPTPPKSRFGMFFDVKGTPDSGYLDGTTKIHFLRDEQGRLIWEGDMLIDPERVTDQPVAAKASGAARAIQESVWPHGKVPYTIAMNMTPTLRARIDAAMRYFHARTNLRFFPRTNEVEYLQIEYAGSGSSCLASSAGRKLNQSVTIYLVDQCTDDLVQHELGHIIGFHHEHTRLDRDNWINVYPDRIDPAKPACQNTLQLYNTGGMDGFDVGPFDINSVMIYDSYNCSYTAQKLFMTRKDGTGFWGGTVLSGGDIAAARYVYPRRTSSRIRDFDGDGLSDLLYVDWKAGSGGHISKAMPGDQKFQWLGTWIYKESYNRMRVSDFIVANFDNDKKADVLQHSWSDGTLGLWKNTGSKLHWTSYVGTLPISTPSSQVVPYVADFNGDGLDDVGYAISSRTVTDNPTSFRVFFNNGTTLESSPEILINYHALGTLSTGEYLVGNFNQDNKADVLFVANNGAMYVRLSQGRILGPPTEWMPAGQFFDLNGGGRYLVGDLTCDGKEDLFFVNPADNSGWVAASTGSGFAAKQNWIPAGTFGNLNNGHYLVGYHTEVRSGKLCADVMFINDIGKVTGKKSDGTALGATKTYISAGFLGTLIDGGHYQ